MLANYGGSELYEGHLWAFGSWRNGKSALNVLSADGSGIVDDSIHFTEINWHSMDEGFLVATKDYNMNDFYTLYYMKPGEKAQQIADKVIMYYCYGKDLGADNNELVTFLIPTDGKANKFTISAFNGKKMVKLYDEYDWNWTAPSVVIYK